MNLQRSPDRLARDAGRTRVGRRPGRPILSALAVAAAAALGLGACTPPEDAEQRPPGEELQAFDANAPEALGPEREGPDALDAPAPAVAEAVRGAALEVDEGQATFYADTFEGRQTASGSTFRQSEMVAAHKAYPFGTRLRVTNTRNGNEVEVTVVDRGPFASPGKATPVIDLSRAAAEQLDFIQAGRTEVRVEVLEWGP